MKGKDLTRRPETSEVSFSFQTMLNSSYTEYAAPLATYIGPEESVPFEWQPEKRACRSAGDITDLELYWKRLHDIPGALVADRWASESLTTVSSFSSTTSPSDLRPWYNVAVDFKSWFAPVILVLISCWDHVISYNVFFPEEFGNYLLWPVPVVLELARGGWTTLKWLHRVLGYHFA